MRGIRTRNPLADNEKKAYLVFDVPTVGYENISMSLALSRTGNGPERMLVQYSVDGKDWTDEGLEMKEITLGETFTLVTIDFSEVADTDDNQEFKIRFKFDGPTITEDSGNARFNNISIDGYPLPGGLFDTNQENEAQYLEKVFPNPTDNNLTLQFFLRQLHFVYN